MVAPNFEFSKNEEKNLEIWPKHAYIPNSIEIGSQVWVI